MLEKTPIRALTYEYGSILPDLTNEGLNILRRKQQRLAKNASITSQKLPAGLHIRNALEASLIFVQYEAGSAVCIDQEGWILTCSHCLGENEKEWKANRRKWLFVFWTSSACRMPGLGF